MTDNIFKNDNEWFPSIPDSAAWIHRLSGNFPAYHPGQAPVLSNDNGHIKGWKINTTFALSQTDSTLARSILTTISNYGEQGMGARCFNPGFAFTFGTGEEMVEVLICLHCSWIVFYSSQNEQWLVPSEAGDAKLRTLYERLLA